MIRRRINIVERNHAVKVEVLRWERKGGSSTTHANRIISCNYRSTIGCDHRSILVVKRKNLPLYNQRHDAIFDISDINQKKRKRIKYMLDNR